jgi:arabinogalactan endo-1,4-beta-galactosidase
MKNILFLILLVFVSGITLHSQTFFKGSDLSYVKELEGCGVQWKENNNVKDIISIFKDNGANIARFRIWHTPTTGNNGYTDTETMISRAKAEGLKVILDFHYSDTWADAGTQKCPAAWMAVVDNYSVLADSVYNYTRNTLQLLKDKGIMPEFVQVGNETNGGMCFPGNGTVTWPTNWNKQTLLFNAGIKAVRDIDTCIKIILHVADPKNAEWWAGELKANNVTDYDILGISFYPSYSGSKTINEFGIILTQIKNNFKKDVMVVETGLPWTNSWNDNITNILNGVPAGYGSNPTPEIQAQWLIDLTAKMVATGGIGIVYWEPDWVASQATICPDEFGGSAWENVALFDFSNNLMANGGIRFIQLPTGISMQPAVPDDILLTVFPNPGSSELNVQFKVKSAATAMFEIYDLQGRIIQTFTEKTFIGSNKFTLNFDSLKMGNGRYILRMILNEESYNKSFIFTR